MGGRGKRRGSSGAAGHWVRRTETSFSGEPDLGKTKQHQYGIRICSRGASFNGTGGKKSKKEFPNFRGPVRWVVGLDEGAGTSGKFFSGAWLGDKRHTRGSFLKFLKKSGSGPGGPWGTGKGGEKNEKERGALGIPVGVAYLKLKKRG